jgi:hypothetical protein
MEFTCIYGERGKSPDKSPSPKRKGKAERDFRTCPLEKSSLFIAPPLLARRFIARMRAIARSATLPNGELRTRRRKGERDGRMDERASIRRVHVHGTHTRARAARRLIIEISHVGPPRACGRPCACTPMQRSRDAFMRVRRNLCT